MHNHAGVFCVTCLIRSEQTERLERQNPAEQRQAGKGAGIDHAVPRQIRIASHLLRHGKSGYGARRGEYGQQRDELHIPKAEINRQPEHDAGDDEQTGENAGNELRQMRMKAAALERCAEDDQSDRRRGRRNLTGLGTGMPSTRNATAVSAPSIIGFFSTPSRMPGR